VSAGDREARTGQKHGSRGIHTSADQKGNRKNMHGKPEVRALRALLIRGLLYDALEVRPPHADPGAAPSSPVAVRAGRGLLGEQLPQVVILLGRVAGALGAAMAVARRPLAALLGTALLLRPPVGRQGGRGDEEVDAAALELGVGRHDDELLGRAPGRAGGRQRRGERVVGVLGEHGGRGDRVAELVHVPAEVHDADDVEGAAGAGHEAPKAVAHDLVGGGVAFDRSCDCFAVCSAFRCFCDGSGGRGPSPRVYIIARAK
jgi:hypothetical protein